jgi:hypothetical protein
MYHYQSQSVGLRLDQRTQLLMLPLLLLALQLPLLSVRAYERVDMCASGLY